MNNKCSICGCEYRVFAFKSGFICEECLAKINNRIYPDSTERVDK